MAVDEGFGTTITFQSGLFATIRSVSVGAITRNALDNTHNLTTNGWRTFQPSDLKDAGELRVELLLDGVKNIKTAVTAAAEAVTVTMPTAAGGSTGLIVSANGFLTSFEFTDPFDDMMTATATIKFSGEITWTVAT